MGVPVLTKRECIICGEVGTSLTSDHYCQAHMKSMCCMSNKVDKWGRSNHCNDLLPPLEKVINGRVRKFCISHWKTYITKCRYCNRDSVNVEKDGRGYCAVHGFNKEKHSKMVFNILKSSELNEDICRVISEKSVGK